MCKKLIYVILFILVSGLCEVQALGQEWDRAAYWDGRYPSAWGGGGEAVRDALEAAGYTILDADELKVWMDGHIADKELSVVVFCRDVVPDTVAETMTSDCTIRRYLDAGGKVVWYSDWPFYYQGSSDGSMVTWGSAGATNVLGFNASSGPNDTLDVVEITDAGAMWGLTETWESQRPTSPTISENMTALATISSGSAAAWVKHYLPGDNYRGFVRTFDRGGAPSIIDDLIRLAEYAATKSGNPDPADGGFHEDTWASISWGPGAYAASHDVYFSDNFDDVDAGAENAFLGNQADTYFVVGFPGFPFPDGLVPGTTYYWRVDDVQQDGVSKYKGNVWSFTVPPIIAYNPIPADGAKFIDPNEDLSWASGLGAKLHTVYFGDNFDDVNNAAGGLPQADTTYTLDTLELDKAYYWRVDEFDPPTTHKGDVWSFQILPNIPIADPSLIGWWKLDEGGTIAVDWSGHDNHGTLQGDPQWVAGHDGDALDFDGSGDWVTTDIMPADFGLDGSNPKTVTAWVYTRGFNDGGIYDMGSQSNGQEFCLRTMTVNNDWRIQCWGFSEGFDHDFTYPTLGTWVHFAHVYDGTSTTLYANGEQADFYTKTLDTANAVFVIGRYGSSTGFNGIIDDLRLFNKALTQAEVKETMRGDPLLAWDSKPSQRSTLYIRDATPLSWSPGDNASQHDVYFGTDKDAVANADESDTSGIYRGRQGATNYTPPEGVEWGGGPYYWRIDEYNNDDTISKGRVWTFSVADYLIVDDFESYNDLNPDDPASNRIFNSWLDGFDNPAINGSVVGHANPPFAEQTIVHGGGQSMPFAYNNGVGKSEATLTLTDTRDWTQEGVGVLSLWFYGDTSNAAEPMYVVLNGTAGVDNDNPNAAQDAAWTEWTIDLQSFADQGVNLSNVNTITIGFGNRTNPVAGGSGMVFFDDIRLYRPAP